MFHDQNLKHRKLVVGVGSALVDILAREDDEFLRKTGAIKGGMKYVDKEFIELTMSQASRKPTMVPGGSACNTVIGIGKLGGHARFVGKRGKDKLGGFFETNLRKNNVDPVLFKSSSFTGRVLSIITNDAQRSMFTFLGASSETQPKEITKKCFENSAIVHIEGYLLFNEALILAALTAAKEAGAMVSLDLASFTVVEEFKVFLKTIVKDFVDILLANEDEALAYTGYSDEIKAVRALSEHTYIAALKMGERGSYISHGSNIIKIEPVVKDAAVDTTGAGDLWASGFLFGLVNGYSLEQCGNLGSACGYEVCQVVGANIPEQGWQRIKKHWRNHGKKKGVPIPEKRPG
jgi:sugar/nucleoside kinase (ribokinase family)